MVARENRARGFFVGVRGFGAPAVCPLMKQSPHREESCQLSVISNQLRGFPAEPCASMGLLMTDN